MKHYSELVKITLTVNGEKREIPVRPSDTLLRVLREKLGLTGTKAGCEHGDCGACTVQLDGKPVKSCLILAVEAEENSITTIEGLKNEKLKNSFIRNHGFQCGYCTSGMLMNADALLKAHPENGENPEIRKYMESNLCRCTGYEGIQKSLEEVLASKMENDKGSSGE